MDEELGASARYEDARAHVDPQAAELRPTDDVFDGLAADSAVHHRGELSRGIRG
jgi:hypothetical protein